MLDKPKYYPSNIPEPVKHFSVDTANREEQNLLVADKLKSEIKVNPTLDNLYQALRSSDFKLAGEFSSSDVKIFLSRYLGEEIFDLVMKSPSQELVDFCQSHPKDRSAQNLLSLAINYNGSLETRTELFDIVAIQSENLISGPIEKTEASKFQEAIQRLVNKAKSLPQIDSVESLDQNFSLLNETLDLTCCLDMMNQENPVKNILQLLLKIIIKQLPEVKKDLALHNLFLNRLYDLSQRYGPSTQQTVHDQSIIKQPNFTLDWEDDAKAAGYVCVQIIYYLHLIPDCEELIGKIAGDYHQKSQKILAETNKTPTALEDNYDDDLTSARLAKQESSISMESSVSPENYYQYQIMLNSPDYYVLIAAIETLGKIQTTHSADSLVNLALEADDGKFIPPLAQALSKVEPEYSAGKIIGHLATGSSLSETQRIILLRILFRLELDRVGVSDEGLEYLGRRFDLGEHNDPTNFVQRITADGKVGVFDAEKRLEGFVQLEAEDFSQAGDNRKVAIRKEVIAIASEILFTPKADDTEEDEANRQNVLEQFITNYYDTYIVGFNQRTGVLFNNLSLQEQSWALSYLNSADEEKKDKFYDLVKSHGENALKTFVAVEYGSQLGDQIIELSEVLDKEKTENFFRNFSNVSDSARELSQLFAEISEQSELNVEFIKTQLFEAIIRKTKDFIVAAKESVSNPDSINFNEILNAMNEFRFVLSEIIEAIQLKGDKYHISKQYNPNENTTTYILLDKNRNYQINLVVRPEETQTTINDEKTGKTETIQLHPGIRTTFIWPDKKRFGIRLDLDPHYSDQEFPNGRLSLDIGSQESKITQILDRTSHHGHHNVMSFSPELSNPEVFSRLCLSFRDYLDQMEQFSTV